MVKIAYYKEDGSRVEVSLQQLRELIVQGVVQESTYVEVDGTRHRACHYPSLLSLFQRLEAKKTAIPQGTSVSDVSHAGARSEQNASEPGVSASDSVSARLPNATEKVPVPQSASGTEVSFDKNETKNLEDTSDGLTLVEEGDSAEAIPDIPAPPVYNDRDLIPAPIALKNDSPGNNAANGSSNNANGTQNEAASSDNAGTPNAGAAPSVCPNCGKATGPCVFCPHCGTRVANAEPAYAKYCPHCGAENGGSKFCGSCGTSLQLGAPNVAAAANSQPDFIANVWNATKKCWRKYADFEGRASQTEYCYFLLFNVVAGTILGAVSGGLLSLLYSVAALVPSFAAQARRLHDAEKSAWWLLLHLIPLAGLAVVIVCALLEPTPGPNKYGDVPEKF